MREVLLDTNIVARLAEKSDPSHLLVADAVRRLVSSGVTPCLTAQVLVEFWVIMTRPREVNGFGWDPETARLAIDGLTARFLVLPEVPECTSIWLEAVTRHRVRGKRAHDVRLAASAMANGVGEILTLNPGDYANITGIAVIQPSPVE